ncbi:MAG: hypothetical protein K2X77_06300 [Candidatus Obscuribacterales bacterium]|jgi:hypothetical protein|nr:hypothetical protein [Candidatus Obscuribacterales bacterium]
MHSDRKEITPKFTEASLLQSDSSRHVLTEAAISAVKAGLVDPTRAIAQVSDKILGSRSATEIAESASFYGLENTASEFGTAKWFAQQFGAAVGMMAPYLVARGAVRAGVNSTLGESSLSTAHILTRESGGRALWQAAKAESIITGSSGFIYGLTFVPASDETVLKGTGAFAFERLKNAAYDGLAFGAIGAMSPYIGFGLSTVAKKVDNLDTKSITESVRSYEHNLPLHDFLPKVQSHLVHALRGPILTGAISGIPIGLVNAEIGALKNGKALPEAHEIKENIVSMMFVGSALSKINHIADKRNRSAAEKEMDATWRPYTSDWEYHQRVIRPTTKEIDAQYARSLNQSADFVAWVEKNQKSLNSGKFAYAQHNLPELANIWNELPTSARTLKIEDAASIMRSWKAMTPRQKELSGPELISYARVLDDFSYAFELAKMLDRSPDFVSVYRGLQSRWHDRSISFDGSKLLENWSIIPEHIKKAGDRELMIIGGSWDKLTPTQQKLPLNELLKTATIIHDVHLTAADSAMIEKATGFVEWYQRKTGFAHPDKLRIGRNSLSRYDFSEVLSVNSLKIRAILMNWAELRQDLKNSNLQTMLPISEIWSSLTPKQKKAEIAELSALASAQKSIYLDKSGFANLERAPDFLNWFKAREAEQYKVVLQRSEAAKLLDMWPALPKGERQTLTLEQALDIGSYWKSLKETNIDKPIKQILHTVSIAKAMELDPKQAEILAKNPSFETWFNANIGSADLHILRNETTRKQFQTILEQWPEYQPEMRGLSVDTLKAVSQLWPDLPSELRINSGEVRNVAKLREDLELSGKEAVSLLKFEPLMTRINRHSDKMLMVATNLTELKSEIKTMLGVLDRLPAKDKKQFAAWFDKYAGDLTNDSRYQLKALFKIIANWEHFSRAERGLEPFQLMNKSELISDLRKAQTFQTVQPGARIPNSITNTLADLKPWQQLAFLKAWESELKNTFDGKTPAPAEFNKAVNGSAFRNALDERYYEVLKAGRNQLLAESNDVRRIIGNSHPNAERPIVELIASALEAQQNALDYMPRINPREFEEALSRMSQAGKSFVEALGSMNQFEAMHSKFVTDAVARRNWEADSAAKLLTTFGARWRSVNNQPGWLEAQQALGNNAHDATVWLALTPKTHSQSLGEFLMRFHDRPQRQLAVVAQKWSRLTQEERKGSYKSIVAAAATTRYENSKSREFAIEASRWGVSERNYPAIENRFLRSQETPMPFPLNKSWTNEDLTGRFLPRNDARGVFLGSHTDCCQHVNGGAGAAAAWLGQESPIAGFFVVENKKKDIVAQSVAWEADNGGLVFDSIEGKGLGERAKKVADIYDAAAADLNKRYHTITVGVGLHAGVGVTALGRWKQIAKEEHLSLPFDYAGYTDAKSQVLLSSNKEIAKKNEPAKTVWMRGASDADLPSLKSIMELVYPSNWRFVTGGDLHRVMEARGSGVIGGYVLDTVNRAVNDAFVHPDYRANSRTMLFDMLKRIRSHGGEWNASMRESTSFELLQKAVKAGWITILNESKLDGAMQGENMHNIKFRLNSRVPTL